MIKNGIKVKNFVLIAILLGTIILGIFVLNSEIIKNTYINKYVYDLEEIQIKVNSVIDNYKKWGKYNPNETGNYFLYLQELGFLNANSASNPYINEFNEIITKLEENEYNFWDEKIDTILGNYYYFSSIDLKNKLGIDKELPYDIIVNFYNGNIITKNFIEINGKKYYRQYDFEYGNKLKKSNMFNNEIITKFEVIENFGLSQKIRIKLETADTNSIPEIREVYYFVDGTQEKKKCSILDDYNKIKNEVTFTISVSGNYMFVVEDSNYIQYKGIEKEISLCNKPILESGMQGIYINEKNEEIGIKSENNPNWYDYSNDNFKPALSKKEDGSYWVWIPRFIYKENDDGKDIKYVIEKTNVSTDFKITKEYMLEDVFENKNGIWISKNDENEYFSK